MHDITSAMASQVVETVDEHVLEPLSSEPVIVAVPEVQSVSSDTESSDSHMFATAPSSSALADVSGWCDQVPPASGDTADVNVLCGNSGSPPALPRQDSVPPKPWSSYDTSSSDLSDTDFTHVPRLAPAALSNQECSDDIGFFDLTPGLHDVCDMLEALHISASVPRTMTVVNSLESMDPTPSNAAPSPPQFPTPDSPTVPEVVWNLPYGDRHLGVPRLGTPLEEPDADADGRHEAPGAMARRRRRRRAPRPRRRIPTIPGSSPEPARLTRDEGVARVLRRRRPAPEDDSDEAQEATARQKRQRQGQATNVWRALPLLPNSSFGHPPERRL
ncbi:unnamed protein product [Clonostachys solani]|uniref:Uncharacterized protein n=1 Tax=Clonostachys solani TaxID=160281 RepID=A0A9P0EBL8_9HYPO|nr:unnamed protein product [Clonostachys solani]